MSSILSSTSSAYAVYPTYPPASLLRFNPWKNPETVAPPPADLTLAHPFNISPDVYENLLNPIIPGVVAIFYLVAADQVNKLNKARHYKPWVSTGRGIFFWSVFVHNVLLAIFSGWTCVGMYNAIASSWPGWDGEHGLAGVADALCKINGPRGLGSAATYDMATTSWGFTDRTMKLLGGEPDSSDVGRIWNEGLAYYGFLFYLSKLYEVVDTAIILAKGKTSSGLQSFHHAGAMICVWAGIRYMSPPIWMFTFINAGIHTLMYTYYALAPLTNIPPVFKRTLTTLQIIQIVFGTSYALLHLFVAYDIPASTPYIFSKNLSSMLPAVSKTLSTAATSLATSVDFAAWLKKAALRAAGEEGLAENVRNYQGETFGIDAIHAAQVSKAQKEIRYRLTTKKVHCLDTSSQVFAILLNAVYLIPLAYLFCEFFYNTYVGNIKRRDGVSDEQARDEPLPSTPENLKKAAQEAVSRVMTKIKQAIEDTQGGVTEPPPDVKAQLDDLHTKAKQIAKNADEAVRDRSVKAKEEWEKDLSKMQDRFKILLEKGNDVGARAVKKIKEIAADLTENAKKTASKGQQGAQALGGKAKESAGSTIDAVASTANSAKQGVNGKDEKPIKEEVKDGAGKAEDIADDATETAKDETYAAVATKKPAEDASDKAEETAKDAAGKTSEATKEATSKASEASTSAEKTNDTAKTDKESDDKKKEESEDRLAPSASTGDERSISSSAGNGSSSRASTPSGTPDKSKKKDKKDKKDGKK